MAGEDGDSEGVIRRDRFSGGPARGFMSSLAADERIFEADLAVDRAHVVMLASQDIIESEVASDILAALDEVEAAGHDSLSGGEDVHEAIEAAVIDIVGPDGGKMHTARSRNDEVATCIRYRLREDVLSVLDAALALRESLLETAAEHTETVMPGYTHLQPAQPTTVAHFLLSYERAVARDCARLMCAYERINQSPLGSAAFAGTPFDVNRELAADLLGFDRVMENSMDASATRDFLAETLSALTTHAVTLSGLAEDLVIFSNKGLVELSDDYSSTSSIMPQKKNPDTMELVRAVAGDAVGELTGLLTTLKGLPRAYNRDLQRAHKHAFRTVDDVGEAAAVAAGAVASAAWPEDELAAAAGDGFSTATGVADLLAMAGLPFRTAHEVVAEAAARSEGTPDVATLDAVATDVLGESLFTHVTAEAVEAALDPTESVASRDSVGGPAPAAVEATLSTARDELSDDAAAVADARDSLSAATEGLDEEVSSYV
ncbi:MULTISPECIES: argininosuccinate lyase [unclassified Haloferax]|uniref:argininosuccinate lyase n=1 Tax=unclassified Haloferax TaxID=2625095 RepID=UPI0002B0DE40|nr:MULTISPECIES: argininosuccinate lyase [unclassified Haloferax]ELZ57586.1 argininosuccinate lyase [Haloferax sp. ATCC BAA-646]ELZ62555.1 argininosuccinate lyase [Haloferax sp. ATCC BAA-645]ELZ64973.1 argininosuccinate lyase [Haloferax sp. ATCC BAA-644]